MNINRTLLEQTWSDVPVRDWRLDLLGEYGCWRDEIEHFLTHTTPFLDRQRDAIKIIESIMTRHGKTELLKYVAELARVEHGIRELEPWVRDHVVHALLSFLLGIYLNEKFLKPETEVGIFQWKLAGLLHDVGYPVQIAKDILRPFGAKINEIKRALGVSAPDVRFKIVPVGVENLTNGVNSLDLIQRCINEWGLGIDARSEYSATMDAGEVCHGMISSLSVLYVLDLMYSKYNPKREYSDVFAVTANINWNQAYFDEDILPACSAIFVHNLPARCFANAKIKRVAAPLAFLLKLADCLQDWERPSLDDPVGLPATHYDIEVTADGLVFHADVPDERKDKIREEIFSCLEAPDIRIV